MRDFTTILKSAKDAFANVSSDLRYIAQDEGFSPSQRVKLILMAEHIAAFQAAFLEIARQYNPERVRDALLAGSARQHGDLPATDAGVCDHG